MRHRSRRTLASLIGTFAAFGLLPSAAGALVVGIGDQSPSMFSDPAFVGLHVRQARLGVTWDVAVKPSQKSAFASAAAWISAAESAGVSPLVSFSGDGN